MEYVLDSTTIINVLKSLCSLMAALICFSMSSIVKSSIVLELRVVVESDNLNPVTL